MQIQNCQASAKCLTIPQQRVIYGGFINNQGYGFQVNVPTTNVNKNYKYIYIYIRVVSNVQKNLLDLYQLNFRNVNVKFTKQSEIQSGNYAEFECESTQNPQEKHQYSIHRLIYKVENYQLQSQQEKIIFNFKEDKTQSSKINAYITRYGIATNCMNNCITCQNMYNCNKCVPGYQLKFFYGFSICEQMFDCNIPDCFTCFRIAEQNKQECLRCMPGFKNEGGSCIKLSTKGPACSSTQYISQIGNSCQSYSKKCFFYEEDSQLFKPCQNEDFDKFLCKQEETIIIFGLLMGDIYNCVSNDLIIDKCSVLADLLQCVECIQGYEYNSTLKKCQVNNCSEGFYIDIQSNSCKPCGNNCISCNSERCFKCQNSSYIFDKQNSRSCKLCDLSNCKECNVDGTCEVCQDTYFKNDSHSFCVKCSAVNCLECHIDGPYFCQQDKCKTNYLFHNETRQCICPDSNCFKCQADDGKKCEQCSANFKLDDQKKCQPKCEQKNCKECDKNDNKKCIKCEDGFILDQKNSICFVECKVAYCDKCQPENGNICVICQKNYDLNENKCLKICSLQYCKICDEQNTSICKECQPNYALDGNNNCKKNCIDSNCKVCQEDGTNCKECKVDYKLDNGKCVLKCDVQNCKECEQKDNQICKLCQNDFYLNQNSKCETCKVSNCIKCQWNNSQLCEKCQDEYTKDKTQKKCTQFKISEPPNDITLKQKVNLEGYLIYLEFKKELIIDSISQFNEEVLIYIENLSSKNSSILLEDKKYVNGTIILSSNNKGQKLIVEFKDEYFQKLNSFKKNKYEFQLDIFVVQSTQEKEAAQQAGNINKDVSQSFLMSLIPVIIFGNYYILINTIDHTSFIYYLLYVNVRYPHNVLEFCSNFKNFQFPFIPNLFAYMIDPNYIVQSPKKFMEMEADSYFLKNGGQGLTICMIVISMYLIVKILSKYMPWIRLKDYLIRKVDETWEYSAFFDMIGTSYIYVLVGVFLQFCDFDASDPYGSSYINFLLFAINFVLVVYYPYYLVKLIKNVKNIASDKFFQKKYNSVVGGLKLYNSDALTEYKKNSQRKVNFQKFFEVIEYKRKIFEIQLSGYCTAIGYIRKFLFCLVIVYFHNFPPIQLMIFIFLSLLMSFYYFYVRPYESKIENIKNGVCEFFLIGFEICLMYLIDDQPDQLESDRSNVGWVIVSFCSLIIGVNAITMVIELFKIFKFILVKFVFAICIHKFKRLHKSQIERFNTRKGSRKSARKQSDIEINSDSNNNQNQDQQTENVLSAKQLSAKDTIQNDTKTQRKSKNVNVLIPSDSPQLDSAKLDSPKIIKTTHKSRKSSHFLKEDTIFRNSQTTDYKGLQSPSDIPEGSTFFKSNLKLPNYGSSCNFNDNSIFSSVNQDKIMLPDNRSESSKYQGDITNIPSQLELNKLRSQINLILSDNQN